MIVELSGISRLKPIHAALAAVVAIIAETLAIPPVRAATPHITVTDGEPLRQILADLDTPSLLVRLNADGSLVVSQRDKAGAAITLPSAKALSAELEALLPQREERKKLAVAVDSTLPYVTLLKLMNEAYAGGFDEVSILGPGKDPHGELSELVIHFPRNSIMDPNNKFLFVSLGNDGNVRLQLGLGADAQITQVNLAGALDAAAGLVPKGRPMNGVYLRADFEVPIGKVLYLLRALRAIGFTKAEIIGEATE